MTELYYPFRMGLQLCAHPMLTLEVIKGSSRRPKQRREELSMNMFVYTH